MIVLIALGTTFLVAIGLLVYFLTRPPASVPASAPSPLVPSPMSPVPSPMSPVPNPVIDVTTWHARYTIEFTDQAARDPSDSTKDMFDVFARFNGQVVKRDYRSETVGNTAMSVIKSMNMYVQFKNVATRSKDIDDAWNALQRAEYAKNVEMILHDGGMVPKPSPLCPNEGLICTAVYRPVCGVDQKTYGNACTARSQCVEIAYEGSCSKCPPNTKC